MQQNENTVLESPRTELTGAFQTDDFGTPISIDGWRGGRPKGVSPSQPVVPGRIRIDV